MWLLWLLHKQDTWNKLPFLTVVTTEKLFLAQAVVPSVVLAKYRELIVKMVVLSSKCQTDFSQKFGSTKLMSDIKLNFLVLVCGFFRQGVLLSPQVTTIQFAWAVCACINKVDFSENKWPCLYFMQAACGEKLLMWCFQCLESLNVVDYFFS